MALHTMEGFETHRTQAALEARYQNVTFGAGTTFPAGAASPSCISVGTTATTFETYPLTSPRVDALIGARLELTNAVNGLKVLQFEGTDGFKHCSLRVNTAGGVTLDLYEDEGNTVIAAGTTVFSSNTWHYVELKLNISTGAYEMRIDENTEFSGTGDLANSNNTTNSNIYTVIYTLQSSSGTVKADDMYWVDAAVFPNSRNNFLGTCIVEGIRPTGAGATTELTSKSGGANYLEVDEADAPDGDTSYNYSTATDVVDTYAFGNLSTIADDNIYGVQLSLDCKMQTAGSRSISPILRTNSTDYNLSSQTVDNTDYKQFYITWGINPDDTEDFAQADINGAEFGIKIN